MAASIFDGRGAEWSTFPTVNGGEAFTTHEAQR
jgi:hypothetical protein